MISFILYLFKIRPTILHSHEELDKIHIVREQFHGEWNYQIVPQK